MDLRNERRSFLNATVTLGAGLVLSACQGKQPAQAGQQFAETKPAQKADTKGGEVTATEDLMREHGILRRALLVYTAAASKLRTSPKAVPATALRQTAQLFRSFGEDYHEQKLEETYIFPAVKKTSGPAQSYPDILIVQHNRGREVTDFILAASQNLSKGTADAEPLARALETFVLMYRHHAAREDTIVFPAWKQTLSEKELDEMGEKFEEIEHQQFGADGFEHAAKQISAIETNFGLADIAQFTPPPPPKV